ncbi:LysR family transcriptional regulator [uncultured Roseibium sp.]|uniref:LysR family transcriptional regulator n=1 Tax=uncultured Roseibium sp. TaxID=1936171 RepID=UPI0026272E45|nr:LysR family transcriptional regulator [uncultured Roseibium sp.]
MNWDDLRILLALIRSGSLTRASVMLGIDQSTVGRRLSALEAALGATLFLRSKSGIIPTEVGEKLIADAMEIERRAERISQVAASPVDEPAGELRILGDHWVLEHLAEHFLPSLAHMYPKLTVFLLSGCPTTASWSAATISLWFEDPPQMGEFSIKLVDVPFALYTPAKCDPAGLGWIAMRDTSGARRAPARYLEKIKERDEPIRLVGNDPRLLLTAIRQGLGKGLLPVPLADMDPGLQRLEGARKEIDRALHLHVHPDTVQFPRVQTVIRELRESAQDLFGKSHETKGTRLKTERRLRRNECAA